MADRTWEVWLDLRERFGERITLTDLYALEGLRLGLAAHELPAADRERLVELWKPVGIPGWERTVSNPGPVDPVVVVPYDPAWPERYELWHGRLAAALGATAVIEHVGSTSVPGLAAKPVIDVQVAVADVEDEAAYAPAIESTGLVMRGREPGHRLFRRPVGEPRDVHVHVCAAGGDWERDHLRFRDLLRRDPAARDAYGRLKLELAERYGDDRYAYTEAKTGFVLDVLDAGRHQPPGTVLGDQGPTARPRPASGEPEPVASGEPADGP